MIKKTVQYSISVVNCILMAVAVFMFDSKNVALIIDPSGNPVVEISKWLIMIFGLLPILFVFAVNYRKDTQKELENRKKKILLKPGKLAPVSFVILLLIGWLTVIIYNSRLSNTDVKWTALLIILVGAVLMYCSDFFENFRTDSAMAKFLPKRLKDETLWHRSCRAASVSCAAGSYVIMMSGVAGLLYNSRTIVIIGFIIGFLCLIIPSVVYILSLNKKLKKKKKMTV